MRSADSEGSVRRTEILLNDSGFEKLIDNSGLADCYENTGFVDQKFILEFFIIKSHFQYERRF